MRPYPPRECDDGGGRGGRRQPTAPAVIDPPGAGRPSTPKADITALENAPIKMVDTSYGHYEAKQKRDVVRAGRKMTPQKREDLRRVIDEMDASTAATANADDTDDEKNEPTNITPI